MNEQAGDCGSAHAAQIRSIHGANYRWMQIELTAGQVCSAAKIETRGSDEQETGIGRYAAVGGCDGWDGVVDFSGVLRVFCS